MFNRKEQRKLKRLYVGVTRDSLASKQRPSIVLKNKQCRCDYCSITAPNNPNTKTPMFYQWVNKRGARPTIACAFCAQSLNINTLGQDNGIFLMYSELNQNQTIMGTYAAFAVIGLNYTPPEPPAPGEDAPIDDMGVIRNHASSFLTTLHGVGGRNLIKMKIRNSPEKELEVVSKALENAEDYQQAITNTIPFFRYVPKYNANNKEIANYFYQHYFLRNMPEVSEWISFANQRAEAMSVQQGT